MTPEELMAELNTTVSADDLLAELGAGPTQELNPDELMAELSVQPKVIPPVMKPKPKHNPYTEEENKAYQEVNQKSEEFWDKWPKSVPGIYKCEPPKPVKGQNFVGENLNCTFLHWMQNVVYHTMFTRQRFKIFPELTKTLQDKCWGIYSQNIHPYDAVDVLFNS